MSDLQLKQIPSTKVEMLIRRPVTEVFEAFINPDITSRFWFTKGSARLEEGKIVRWDWEMYNASAQVNVLTIEENKRIVVEWPSYKEDTLTQVEWIFIPYEGDTTFVRITETGFSGNGDEVVQQVIDSTGGFTFVLSGLKAFLEHNVSLNLVADHHPKGLEN